MGEEEGKQLSEEAKLRSLLRESVDIIKNLQANKERLEKRVESLMKDNQDSQRQLAAMKDEKDEKIKKRRDWPLVKKRWTGRYGERFLRENKQNNLTVGEFNQRSKTWNTKR